MGLARVLATFVAAVMTFQAVLGLAFRGQYRDVEWIRLTWLGNDLVTLVFAVPLLVWALGITWRKPARDEGLSVRGQLLGLGVLGYGVYNYAFYLFGAALNVFFPLYIVAFVASLTGLIVALTRVQPDNIAERFSRATPGGSAEAPERTRPQAVRLRVAGGYLVFVACGLTAVWIGFWAGYVFWGRPTPIEPEAFKLVAALDLALMVPALSTGGILLWRRHPWGYIAAAIAGIQGTLYLTVLTVNSAMAIAEGLVPAPGELPVWATLGLGTAAATAALLMAVRERD